MDNVLEDVSVVLKEYYSAYLDAINDQNPRLLRHVTYDQEQRLRERISDSVNQTDIFRFSHIVIDLDTLRLSQGGRTLLSFTASFHFSYQDRRTRGDWNQLFNVQTVEMVFDEQGRAWLVDFGVLIHPDPLGANQRIVR